MTNNKQQTEHRFCLTPELKCTMSYCDENGCINRQRHLVGDPIEMTNNKQQTAVEWFANESWQLKVQLDNQEISVDEYAVAYVRLLYKAKEMEKEKHEKLNKFLNDEKQLGISDLKTIERIQWYYNTYFNETYGGGEQ